VSQKVTIYFRPGRVTGSTPSPAVFEGDGTRPVYVAYERGVVTIVWAASERRVSYPIDLVQRVEEE